MLVEDSTTQAISLTALLEQEGWRVTWVSSAEKAFSTLRETLPDLILLDYHLPGIRGDEVCRRIRMNVDTRSLPIVMLTSQEGQQVQGLDSGADDFVAKSTNPEVLLLRLRTLLQKSGLNERIIHGSEDSSFQDVHLLAIDDSAIFLDRLKHELSKEGYKLETCTDGEEGIKRLGERKFDGVIIDLVMPRMDGFEVCKHVNALRKSLHLPLITILLTGADSTDNLSRALEAGADDFVGKSNDYSILKGRIRALLRRKFFAEENNRILQEFRQKELEALRERAAKEAAEARAELVEELKRSQEELKRASAAKDQFMAMLSHELRTPLTPVMAVVEERSQDASLPEDVRRDFQMIRRNVQLEAHLINDLLDLTRITQDKMEFSFQPVDMARIIREVVEMCKTGDREQPTIHIHTEIQDACLMGDSVRLTQVVWNLLQNAIKFTPNHGSIEVSLKSESRTGQPFMVLEVTDSGAGIEPEMLERIFEAFQQERRQPNRQHGGLGLGLAISKAIVERHHGRLSATSAGANQGSTFRLALPMQLELIPKIKPVDAADGQSDDVSGATESHKPTRAQWRILLVEDHEDTRDSLARLLRRRGHEVHVATSVAEAAAQAAEVTGLQILISDVGLPDGDGMDVLREVMKIQKVHAIALSGFGMKEDVQRSLDSGYLHHLTKPVQFTQLEAALAH